MFTFLAHSESDTDRLGAALAQVLPRGAVVALVGTLGAGKTRLVQAVAKAAGIDPREVVSPTFVLVHEYRNRGQRAEGRDQETPPDAVDSRRVHEMHRAPIEEAVRFTHPTHTSSLQPPISVIYHLDAYRIRDDDEFYELGPEEFFASDGWTFVEWADRVADCLPPEYLQMVIALAGESGRRFEVAAHGDKYVPVVQALTQMSRP